MTDDAAPTPSSASAPDAAFRVRDATRDDVPDLLRLVRDLAVYEKEPEAATATEAQFETVLFPADGHPAAYALVAERDGRVVGMAIWFTSFSTWTGRQGLWLEDLFVEPEQRGLGIGKALLVRLAQICVERDWSRFEWWVLDWNTPSIEFYRSQGAVGQDEWTTFRVDGDALSALAGSGG
ncbi:MAG: GCN5-related N-acetyltransferase [Humibacillus sp.]|nr:GCN5-related N-acetyltransferase [Humibacillus sp.]